MPELSTRQGPENAAARCAASTAESSMHSANRPKSTKQGSVLQYLQTDQLALSRQGKSADQNAGLLDDMTDTDLLDEMAEVWEDEEPDAPWPKKPNT